MGVYVMRTLRFFFHMGSVECVTFHWPVNHASFGGGIVGEGVVDGRVEGARRVSGCIVEKFWMQRCRLSGSLSIEEKSAWKKRA